MTVVIRTSKRTKQELERRTAENIRIDAYLESVTVPRDTKKYYNINQNKGILL